MKKISFLIVFAIGTFLKVFSNGGVISGTIVDAESKEGLIGATILIQGTNTGTVTDVDGKYTLKDLASGTYNLICTYVSYEQEIITVNVDEKAPVTVDITLKPVTIGIGEVEIKKARRTDTELSLLTSIKATNLIVNGISAQQISRTQDKDAAEVIRRVPGITLTDGKFVIVRGLIERYNSVLLNGASAPSFEANKRAFSMDAVPSGMINNILIYKSPAPELPADFSGAVIEIMTKDNADKNELTVSYAAGYKENTSFNKEFLTYQGGKYDWIGVDDGTRNVPSTLPAVNEFKELYVWNDLNDYQTKMEEINKISKDFNSIWTPTNKTPFLDQSFSTTLRRRFVLGKVSFGNITSVSYKNEYSQYNVIRREYENYNDSTGEFTTNFDYNDSRSKSMATVGIIHNWLIVLGKNQRIEFRNFMNNMGESSTSIRDGDYIYNSETSHSINLKFNQRFIYSGQLAGKFRSNNGLTNIDWLTGYAYTTNNEPDNRRIKYTREIGTENPYLLKIDKEVNVNYNGRLSQLMNENILNGGINFQQNLYTIGDKKIAFIKSGIYYEKKYRTLSSRLVGIVAPRGTQALNIDLSLPVEELFVEDNFFYYPDNVKITGFAYKDGTLKSNNYNAGSNLYSAYIALKLPITRFVELYGGVRAENYSRSISGYYEETENSFDLDIEHDTVNYFPSANIAFNITKKHVVRFSYGKTINRPEFREITPAVYEDFDLNVLIHGNTELTDAYIDNFDARYEWYPSEGEIISVTGFYKKFKNPIEVFLIPAGTGLDYKPENTETAFSKGFEIDIRKSLVELEGADNFFRFFKDFTLIFNTSIIRSEIKTNKGYAREQQRIMQGQSPYIVNLGLYYSNNKSGTRVNFSYNKIGKRIAYAGTPNHPHTWELPRNSVDLSLVQNIGKRFEVSLGVKDLLNEDVRFVQYFGTDENVLADTYRFKPNRKYTIGITMKL